jgi:hypothetical protein
VLCHALICFYFLYLQIALISKRLIALAVAETPPLDVKGSSLQFTLFITYFICHVLLLWFPHLQRQLVAHKLEPFRNNTFKVWVRIRVTLRVVSTQHVLHIQTLHRPA